MNEHILNSSYYVIIYKHGEIIMATISTDSSGLYKIWKLYDTGEVCSPLHVIYVCSCIMYLLFY